MPLHVEETQGAGAPIVLLHGVLGHADDWRAVADALAAAGRRVLLVHARGHGASPVWAPGMDWSPQADAHDVAPLLEAAGRAHLVGHSRGATTAGWLALERPDLVASLAVVASPPQASEVFRARFRKLLPGARDGREREALAYLSQIPDEDFPGVALRGFRGRALVVEAADDPLYSPSGTLFWRMFLPYADFERVDGGHTFFRDGEGARWLADRLLRHVEAAEAQGRAGKAP